MESLIHQKVYIRIRRLTSLPNCLFNSYYTIERKHTIFVIQLKCTQQSNICTTYFLSTYKVHTIRDTTTPSPSPLTSLRHSSHNKTRKFAKNSKNSAVRCEEEHDGTQKPKTSFIIYLSKCPVLLSFVGNFPVVFCREHLDTAPGATHYHHLASSRKPAVSIYYMLAQ